MTGLRTTLVVVLLLGMLAPPFFAPRPAHAQFFSVVTDVITEAESTISAANSVLSQVNQYLLTVKSYVLDPIAFVLSGNALRAVTAGILNFINGKANGTGQSQFARDLRGVEQSASDAQAFAFLVQFGQHSNSPFSTSIASSLRANYLTASSLAGFWAANQCTLFGVSPNVNAFLAGNFRQGGWPAWFALTTQAQNNPYLLYYNAQAELYANTANAVSNQLAELSWGQGFLSWCGPINGSSGGAGEACPAGQTWDAAFQTCTSQSVANATGQQSCPSGEVWNQSFQTCTTPDIAATTNANCTQANGDPGEIQTPGSVIHDGLSKALGSDIDKLDLSGATGEISSLFKNLASIVNTVGYGAALFGQASQGGLFGLGSNYVANGTYFGATAAGIQASQQAQLNVQRTQAQTQAQQQANNANPQSCASQGQVYCDAFKTCTTAAVCSSTCGTGTTWSNSFSACVPTSNAQ